MNTSLLSVKNFSLQCGDSLLLHDLSFEIHQGECVALVGESGSGKTLLARSIIGLAPSPTMKIISGSLSVLDTSLTTASQERIRCLRGKSIGYIPQFSLSSLNPIMTIGKQLQEALLFSSQEEKKSFEHIAYSLLLSCGFYQPNRIMYAYPHELSGGMQQRVLIAMALIHNPQILIADEPTTALDVTLQTEIINLMYTIKIHRGMGILFITHDLGVVSNTADRVIIMRKGKIEEIGETNDVLQNPQSPYTKLLLQSYPHQLKSGPDE